MRKSIARFIAIICIGAWMMLFLSSCGGAQTKSDSQGLSDTSSKTNDYSESITIAFDTVDIDGKSINSDAFGGYSKTILCFISTNSGPCIESMPILEELYQSFDTKDLNILCVVSDARVWEGELEEEIVEAAKNIRDESEVSFSFIVPDKALLDMVMELDVYPTAYIVDADGQTVGEPIVGTLEYADWVTLLKEP